MAGEAAAEHVDWFGVMKLRDVGMDGHVGPVLREDALAVGVLLAEPGGAEPARAFEAEVEATDAREQRAD